MDVKKIKENAKKFAYGNKWEIWKPILFTAAISFAVTLIIGLLENLIGIKDDSLIADIISLIITCGLMPLEIGSLKYLICLVNGEKVDMVSTIFSKYKVMWPVIDCRLLASVLIGCMTLLLIVPGIIYALKLAMVSYLLATATDEEIKNPTHFLKDSTSMMQGHKKEYLLLILSFLGWIILSCLTAGILYIWIMPYFTVTQLMYFKELKKVSK